MAAAATAVLSLSLAFEGCADGVGKTRRFLAGLSCGMSRDQVHALLPATVERWQCDEGAASERCETNLKRGPGIELSFSRSGLEAIRAYETVGPMKSFSHPRLNLCTGERTIPVAVLAFEGAWQDATVIVDGRAAAEMQGAGVELEIALGRRQIALAAGERHSDVAQFELSATSSRVQVTFDATGNATVSPEEWRGPWEPRAGLY